MGKRSPSDDLEVFPPKELQICCSSVSVFSFLYLSRTVYHGDVPCTTGQAVKRASTHRLLGQLRLASLFNFFCLL